MIIWHMTAEVGMSMVLPVLKSANTPSVGHAGPYKGNPPEDAVPATPVDASDNPAAPARALAAAPAQPNFQPAMPSATGPVLPAGHLLPACNGSLPPSSLQVKSQLAHRNLIARLFRILEQACCGQLPRSLHAAVPTCLDSRLHHPASRSGLLP